MRWVAACSMSRSVQERLQERSFAAQVLAVFDHACDLVTRGGDVMALATPHVGNGPFNIVIDGPAGVFAGIERGEPVTLEGRGLRIGSLGVDLGQAAIWEPRPDWHALRSQHVAIASRLPMLRDICLRHAPDGSLLALLQEVPPPKPKPPSRPGKPDEVRDRPWFGILSVLPAANEAAQALRSGWVGDRAQLRRGGAGLAGLGGGLTPAGDDFLAGAMLWAWLAHPTPDRLCHTLVEVAAPRTTILSAAFLKAAARGECSASWHALFKWLSEGREAQIAAAVQEVLSHGATSGADGLAGFLYLGLDRHSCHQMP
jgi:hypothetical protein